MSHKTLKEYPAQIVELKLYYVEVCTEITNEYGDMHEGFYSSLESMFESFCKHIMKYPVYFKQIKDHIHNLQSACVGIGCGYRNVIDDLAFELETIMGCAKDI